MLIIRIFCAAMLDHLWQFYFCDPRGYFLPKSVWITNFLKSLWLICPKLAAGYAWLSLPSKGHEATDFLGINYCSKHEIVRKMPEL